MNTLNDFLSKNVTGEQRPIDVMEELGLQPEDGNLEVCSVSNKTDDQGDSITVMEIPSLNKQLTAHWCQDSQTSTYHLKH